MRLPSLSVLTLALLAAAGSALGQQTTAPAPTAPQAPSVMLENAFKPLGDRAVTIQMLYTGEVFGNLSGGYARGADYEGLITLSLGVDLSKYLNGFSFYVSGLYPHGDGISAKYVHDYDTLSNLDAFDSPRVFELWLQQAFWSGNFTIRAGLLTTDNSFFNSSNAALFVNSAFGTTGVMAHDLYLPTYPLTSEGVRLYGNLTPRIYAQALLVDDNPGFQNTNNERGLRFGYNGSHGLLSILEVGGTAGQAAIYKLGGFYDTQYHPDVANPTDAHGTYGFYALTDQQIWTAPGSTADCPRGVSGFARIQCAPDERDPVVFYFDAGLNGTGLFPGRPADVLGAAFNIERLGTDVNLASGAPVLAHHEDVVELTYLANICPNFSLQPDVQYILNPGGFGKAANALVAGMRFNLTF